MTNFSYTDNRSLGLGIRVNNPSSQNLVKVYWDYSSEQFKINIVGYSLLSATMLSEFKEQLKIAEDFITIESNKLMLNW